MATHRIAQTLRRLARPRPAGAARAVQGLGRRLLAAGSGETGQRLARAVALAVALAVVVVVLYDRGEVPSAAAQPAVGAAPGAAAGGSGGRGAARRPDPDDIGGLRGRPRSAPVGERPTKPAAVAASWYAARHGLAPAKVKPLQQDRLSAGEVRVLVLADPGGGRLRTALVRVRLGSTGWSVR